MAEIIVKLGDQVLQTYPIRKDTISIGRARDNEIVVENLSVSRNHARIRREGGKYVVVDLNSANGSFVNGVKITQVELKDNDIISIGKHKLHFVAGADEGVAFEAEAEPVEVRAAPAPIVSPLPVAPKKDSKAPSFGGVAPDLRGGWGYLLVTRGKQYNVLFRLEAEETSIGRANDNHVRLHDWFVSKRHAIILRDDEGFLVRDLGSWRGITLNGASVRESRLRHGDELVFGTTVVRFHIGPEDYRVEGAVLSSEVASEVPVPEAPGASSDSVPDEYEMPKKIPPRKPTVEERVSDTPEVEDDEFAPMTDEELAELEMESDALNAEHDEKDGSDLHHAEWEQLEAERMLKEGGGWHKKAAELDVEDDAALSMADSHPSLQAIGQSGPDMEEQDEEEERALFGGPVSTIEPGAIDAPRPDSGVVPVAAPVAGGAGKSASKELEVPKGVDPAEFRKWSRGLRNKSRIVRREAARKLKELTGIDYEWERDPEH
jgi:pSer/pThr/pTyr-binding forkhead associated (FHA) protein